MNLKQFLLKNGPYPYEVHIRNMDALLEAQIWLSSNGYAEWEELVGHVDKNGKRCHYLFLRDKAAASYVKLRWG